MVESEIVSSIKVGLGQPRLFKRSIWGATVKVMEYLADNGGEVTRCNKGMVLKNTKRL